MTFDDSGYVLSTCRDLQFVDLLRAQNRARIDQLMNGDPPYTPEEAEQGQIDTNTNFLEGPHIIHDARLKFYNAMFGNSKLLEVTLKEGDVQERSGWQDTITGELNEVMTNSVEYLEEQRQKWAQNILHGYTPMVWENETDWIPRFYSLEDFKVPSRTLVSLRNLEYFAIFRRYTPYNLLQRATGDSAPAGWNQELVKTLIKRAVDSGNTSPNSAADFTRPEQFEQDIKANSGWYGRDMVPTVNTWELFWRRDDGKIGMCVVADDNPGNPVDVQMPNRKKDAFLYYSEDPVGECWDEVVCMHVTDGANVAPFLLSTIRSLGFLLYEVCHLNNRIRSKLFDAIFENMLMWWKNTSGSTPDGETLPGFRLQNYGIVPNGYEPMNAAERHNINEQLAQMGLAENRQLMSEASASFVQGVDNGTKQSITATEAIARLNNANSLLSGMIMMAFVYQTKEYREICRRFCNPVSTNKDVQQFRANCLAKGVPEKMLDVKLWGIRANRPIGGGNQTLEMLQVQQLMDRLALYPEESQLKIINLFTKACMPDPRLADELAPTTRKFTTNATQIATLAMGSLMQGLPVVVDSNIAHGEYVTALSMLAAKVVEQIDQNGGMATEQQVTGLANVYQTAVEQVKIMAQDPNKKQKVKQLMDGLTQIANKVRGYAQRLQEQKQAGGQGMSPEAQAKVQASLITAQTSSKIAEAMAQQKLLHKDEAFTADQRRRDIKLQAEVGHGAARTRADIAMQDAQTAADIQRSQAEAATPDEPK